MKAVNIQRYGIHLPVGVMLDDLIDIIVEEDTGIQSGQWIIAGIVNQASSFQKLDHPADSCENDIRHIKRFGDKIRSTHIQCLYLRTLL